MLRLLPRDPEELRDREVGVHMDLRPISSLAGVTSGGLLFGLVGVLVALPVIAAVRVIWREYRGSPDAPPVAEESFPRSRNPRLILG